MCQQELNGISIMKMIGVAELIIFISCNLRLPYHANVMNVFEITNRTSVRIAFDIVNIFYCFLSVLGGRSDGCMLLIAPHRL